MSKNQIEQAIVEAGAMIGGEPTLELSETIRHGLRTGEFRFNIPSKGNIEAACYAALSLLALTNCRTRADRERVSSLLAKTARVSLQ